LPCLALAVLGTITGAGLAPAGASANGVPFHKGDVLAAGARDVFTQLGSGTIKHFDSSGNLLDTLDTTSGSEVETGMCFDAAGNLYTTNFAANSMSTFTRSGNLLAASFGSGFNRDPESCVFDGANNIYVGQPDGSKHVLKFNTSGTLLASFSPATGPRGTDWVDLASDQCTLRYTSEGTEIKAFNVCTNTQLPAFATGLPSPGCYAHRILADGGELVACDSSKKVVRLNPNGVIIQTYQPGGSELFALSLDPDGTSFWTADLLSHQIWRIDIASGAVLTTFNTGGNPLVLGGLAVVGELTASGEAITATGTTVSATEGTSFNGTVATFSDPDAFATASEYTASIDWGDGHSSAGTVSGSSGSFAVSGEHTYAEEGTFTVTVKITDVDNSTNSATATSTAKVADAALSSTCAAPSTSTQSFAGPTATFTDADPGGMQPPDYSATIEWGDSSISAGTIPPGVGHGPYTVNGTHTYTSTGPFTITTTIKDAGGSKTVATCKTLVFAVLPGGGSFVIGDENATIGNVVTFSNTEVEWWGSNWWKENSLSGGPAPSAFKGFAESSPNPPTCGESWTTNTGNSSGPPATVPEYMAVIAASKITQSGSTISGNTPEVVVVKTNPGYLPNPGHKGTGKVVAIVCIL
jgi:hypothetical protein